MVLEMEKENATFLYNLRHSMRELVQEIPSEKKTNATLSTVGGACAEHLVRPDLNLEFAKIRFSSVRLLNPDYRVSSEKAL